MHAVANTNLSPSLEPLTHLTTVRKALFSADPLLIRIPMPPVRQC